MAFRKQFTAKRDPAGSDLEGRCSQSGFRAKGANRFLELPRREVKIGFNLRGEVGVVLEPEAVCDDLQGEPLGNKASGEEHPVPSEQLLRSKARGPLDGIFQLSVGKLQMLRDPRNRKFLFFGQLEQVFAVRAPEVLSLARDSEFGGVLRHDSNRERLLIGPDF